LQSPFGYPTPAALLPSEAFMITGDQLDSK
jgi:hypothetical protein